MKKRPKISDEVLLDIVYRDDTRYGSAVSGKLEQTIQNRTADLRQKLGESPAAIDSKALRRTLMTPHVLGDFHRKPGQLEEEFLYPNAGDVVPQALSVSNQATGYHGQIALPRKLAAELASWMGDWQSGVAAPKAGPQRRLYEELKACGAIGPAPEHAVLPKDAITFVGHATVHISSGDSTIIIDPFYLPAETEDSYRPLAVAQLPADAVFITHSHPDHYNLGTLLRYGTDVQIYVPVVSRESALSIDMYYRLRELGFSNVHRFAWGDEVVVGECRVMALPFYGEQPTSGESLHPEVRNNGNLYLVDTGTWRVALTADAGRDHLGSTRQMALETRRRHGNVDVVYGGYRSWSLYAHQYLGSSVSRYALFVPESEWNVRQCIMNGIDESLDVAEAFGAREFVPYADGGAPWYWRRGLGPQLDIPGDSDLHFDPRPEEVLRCAQRRSHINGSEVQSPVAPCILRPGQSVTRSDGESTITELDGHRFDWAAIDLTPCAEEPAVSQTQQMAIARKKSLLMLLAPREIRRLGLEVGREAALSLATGFRNEFGLQSKEDMQRWLAELGMSVEQFSQLMYAWANATQLEEYYRKEIDQIAPAQLALQTMPYATGPTHSSSSPAWTQFNVSVHRPGERSDYDKLISILIADIEHTLAPLEETGALSCLFVQRKEPDLRVRICVAGDCLHEVNMQFQQWLDRARQRGQVKDCYASIYEPEYHAFGGVAAMEAVHSYFHADTRFLSALQQLQTTSPPLVSIGIMSVAKLNDLFFRTLEGNSEEVWDVWCRIAELQGLAPDPEGTTLRPIVLANLRGVTPNAAMEQLCPPMIEANKALSGRLLELSSAGELSAGVRAILAGVAMFHLNRHGFRSQNRRKIIQGMINALNPHRSDLPVTTARPESGYPHGG